MRLSKYLSNAGVASRRKAEEIIQSGTVEVNGEIVTVPQTQVEPSDNVKVSGRIITPPDRKAYIILNKPRGIITTMRDTHGRPTVRGLLKDLKVRVYPVGRLDKDVSGVLLCTNDGELAHRLAHPRYEIPKTYSVKVKGILTEPVIKRLREGVTLEEGKTAPAVIKNIKRKRHTNSTTMELTLYQGWKRQIKRMFREVGYPVQHLERIRFAFLETGGLPAGHYRNLTPEELTKLKKLVGI